MSDSSPLQMQLRRIVRSINGLHRRLAEHDKAINGNGDRGCRTRLTLLEERQQQLLAAQTKAFWFALGYSVLGTITLIGVLIQSLAT